jgi:hypothetical protein
VARRFTSDTASTRPADGEQVDLAAGRAQAEAENAVTAEHEPERGQPLAAVALAPGGLAAAAAVFDASRGRHPPPFSARARR